MSAINQAIENLEAAIARLEGKVESAEGNLKGQQREMFKAPAKPAADPIPESPHAAPPEVDTALMAQKIDSAIDKVEALLRGSA